MEEKNKRICIFSQRHLRKFVSRCSDYEFENTISDMDDADIISIGEENPFPPFRHSCDTLSFRLTNPVVKKLSPNPLCISPKKQELKKEYDIFFSLCMSLNDLTTLKFLKGWKEKCNKKVCYIDEIWSDGLEKRTGELRILSQFDYVFLNCRNTVELLQKLINKPCHYIRTGIDAIQFCPYPNPPERSIDVYYIGRRSEELHKQLLRLSDKNGFFYIYDTINNLETNNIIEHRKLLSSYIKRSKFYIVDRAKFNKHDDTKDQHEIGFRFFEGVAAGAVLIGNHPEGEEFKNVFHWPYAVSKIPDSSKISEFLEEFNGNHQKVNSIRYNNIVNTLKHHDWYYRWKTILDKIGEKPVEKSYQRLNHLSKLIETVTDEFEKLDSIN